MPSGVGVRSPPGSQLFDAGVVKLVNAQDLKSCGPNGPCRFDAGRRYNKWM